MAETLPTATVQDSPIATGTPIIRADRALNIPRALRPRSFEFARDPRKGSGISLFRAIEDRDEIWVVNNLKTPRAQISISFGDRGDHRYDPIPPGPDPINLTEIVPHRQIANSASLRGAVSTGLLLLIPTEEAHAYYKEHGDRKEIVAEKIRRLTQMAKEAPARREQVDIEEVLSPRVLQVCEHLRGAMLSEAEGMRELIESEGILTEDDLEYIRSKGCFDSIKLFAKETLEARRAQEWKKKEEEDQTESSDASKTSSKGGARKVKRT